MNALVSGILAVALSNSAPIIQDEQSFVAGYSAYAEGNYSQTRAIWEKLANQNNARAQYGLAVMYEFGQGVPHDYSRAAYWYLKAAKLDFAMAKNNLGMLYERGAGVPLDLAQAVDYYRQAAEQGLPSAQYNLGNMYYEGVGTAIDFHLAAQWLLKSAEQGFASAQYNLGVMYLRGEGVKQNHVDAARWFIQAINTGASRARSGLQSLLEEKPRTQLTNRVALHQQPDKSSHVVTQIHSGNVVYTLEQREEWVAVLLDDKKTVGWIERASFK